MIALRPQQIRRSLGLLLVSIVLVCSLADVSLAKTPQAKPFDARRDAMIAFILNHQLPAQHFSHELINDPLSRKAFNLFMRQLDPRKRFLLQSDVRRLDPFATRIDDELKHGRILLPDVGMNLLNNRIRMVEGFIDPLLAQKFSFNTKEYLELDPKKLTYAANETALKERWRLILKQQVIETYFDLLRPKGQKNEPLPPLAIVDPAKHPDLIAESIKKVRERVHRSLTRLLQQGRQDYYDRYFEAITHAYDPHSDYMPPTTKEDFDIQMSGSLEGIGALLREDDGLIKVVRVIPGSAAEKQGQLQAEDTILAVAEKNGEPVDISDMRIREAVGYIRGPKGTEVRLTVQKPDGRKVVIPIIRDVVHIEETYVKTAVFQVNGKKYGYLRIPSFYRDFSAQDSGSGSRNVTDDTREALTALKKQHIQGLIIDLRNNGGGALTDAVQISGMFLPGGPVVQVKDADGNIRVLEDEDPAVDYDGNLVVLVNQFSASASEILAAALQDYGRAYIIGGAHTHGKGTVQALMDLNRGLPLFELQKSEDLGALKLTIQKFYRINGGSTQYKGVEPDLVVPSRLDYLKSGEKYLDYSLPWDQVKPVPFTRWAGAHLQSDTAHRMGESWVMSSPKFQEIKKETDKAKIRSEQTYDPIYVQGIWKEHQDMEAARKAVKAAGLNVDGDDADTPAEETKKIEHLDSTDPFVMVALDLLSGGGLPPKSPAATR